MIQGFVSYAHDDYWAFKKMHVRLKAIERALRNEIRFWSDERILGGGCWTAEIESAITAAEIHLLLVSADFIASDYIALHELPAINVKYSRGDLVIPVIVSGCIWEPFVGPLQAVPTVEGRVLPICDWWRRDKGFDMASRQILDAVQMHFGITVDSGLEWHRA